MRSAVDLACFDASDLEAIARNVRRELETKLGPPRRAARLQGELVLRDEEGVYYAFGIASLRPYRWDGKAWKLTTNLPPVLEGPASLAVYASSEREAASIDARPAADSLAFLRRLAEGARRQYRRGELTRVQAEAVLSSFYAQDNAGRMWAVGAFTGAWYVFEEKRWQRANEPKASAFSRGARPSDGELTVSDGLLRFVAETDGAPPETLTPAWQPPKTTPEDLPPSRMSSTLSDVAERAKVSATHVESTTVEPRVARTRVDEAHSKRRLVRWLIAAGAVLVLVIVGGAAVLVHVRPWDKGAAKRWTRLVRPVAHWLP